MQRKSFWRRGGLCLVLLLTVWLGLLVPVPRAEAVTLANDWQYQLRPDTGWVDFTYPQLPELPAGTRMLCL